MDKRDSRDAGTIASLALADDFEERVALIEDGTGVPRAWAEGFARLVTMARPACIPERRWRGAIEDGARFLDDFGRQAAALGWEAGDIFGCDPHAPIARGDRLGLAFLIQGAEVSLVDQAGVVLTRGTGSLRFRRSVHPGAPVWETLS